ncbi:hypothetical protein GLAREA_01866 [Glarea lozoyensis ATCC 20868]|uniref:Uncharacterized protein n=1 Tax=Glarea lozoyensis (strain ATCC 20868 / MF5171) TaxID=1116229 RepID=S3CL52_GLAL2|nr:uncharacterized protein GLAREA_01866 [Glarea lozoyensis ATCC 20868]EPE25954.1 hypothetical protein GLAREA_01866 [Glarea lozoyensis ATCC 20868]
MLMFWRKAVLGQERVVDGGGGWLSQGRKKPRDSPLYERWYELRVSEAAARGSPLGNFEAAFLWSGPSQFGDKIPTSSVSPGLIARKDMVAS